MRHKNWNGKVAIGMSVNRAPMIRAFELLACLPKDLSVKGRGKDKPQKRKGSDGVTLPAPYEHLYL
jgi:hypothetical protein